MRNHRLSIWATMIFAVARLLLLLVAVLQLVHIDGVSAAQHDANRWRSQGDQAADNGKLLFAHVLYRHGDRTPVEPYPNDPWGNTSFWPTGWAQLTNIGKEEHYELGQWLHRRYADLLGTHYDKERFYIQSTNVDRTLMSAESNLAGMWTPIKDDVWNPSIAWQPVPVHTIPDELDEILAAKRPCPAFEHELKRYMNTDEYRQLLKRFKPLFEYLTKWSGHKVNTLTGVNNLYDVLMIEELKNMTLPAWTKEVYPGDMKWISARSFATKTSTTLLARLKAGFLLKDILTRFSQKAKGSLKPDRSMWVYSAHDTTVANLLNTLGVFDLHGPPYAACVMLELRLLNDVPVVQVFYKNTTAEPLLMSIPYCGVSCPLAKMYELYEPVLPGNFEDECRMSMLAMTYEEADLNHALAGLFIIGSVLLLLSLICYIALGVYNRRVDDRWYLRIDDDA